MSDLDFPAHIPWRGTLVGPIVRFRGHHVPVTSSPPSNTLDPRWANCTDHHLACDCREAEQNELINELRNEWRLLRETLEVMLAGHATVVEQRDGQPRPDVECQCQLCEFARRAHLVPRRNHRSDPFGCGRSRW